MNRRYQANRPLRCYAEGFEEELYVLGFSEERIALHIQLLGDLGQWLSDEGLGASELTQSRVEEFMAARRGSGHRELVTSKGSAPLLEYLRSLGAVPPAVRPAPDGPVEELVERYRDYLTSERGLADRVVLAYVAEVVHFARHLAGAESIDWATVSTADVSQFVIEVCRRGRVPANLLAALRSFLRFVQLEGLVDVPLAASVPSVAQWGGASLPRRLEPGEVRRLLASCDRRTVGGRRDYAVLLMLVRLGLRAGEVARMQLGDIDWRAGELVVRGKGPREEKLPLPVDVGKALADYLAHGRPKTGSRDVFVRLQAPWRGFMPTAVTALVYSACARAGLTRVSAHVLRHTAATELLRAGASLGEVGQVLRQRTPSATAIYAKVDHASLRPLARQWPGGAA